MSSEAEDLIAQAQERLAHGARQLRLELRVSRDRIDVTVQKSKRVALTVVALGTLSLASVLFARAILGSRRRSFKPVRFQGSA